MRADASAHRKHCKYCKRRQTPDVIIFTNRPAAPAARADLTWKVADHHVAPLQLHIPLPPLTHGYYDLKPASASFPSMAPHLRHATRHNATRHARSTPPSPPPPEHRLRERHACSLNCACLPLSAASLSPLDESNGGVERGREPSRSIERLLRRVEAAEAIGDQSAL